MTCLLGLEHRKYSTGLLISELLAVTLLFFFFTAFIYSFLYLVCISLLHLCNQLLLQCSIHLCHRSVTVIVMDSRGAPLQRMIVDPNVIIEARSGARLQDMVGLATSLIKRHNPISCLIVAGINNMTRMNRQTRKVSLIYYDPFDLANHIIRLINRIRRYLIYTFPGVKFGFGGIIGMNLNHYNNLDGYSPHQWVMDEAVRQINAYIRLLNQQAHLYHPRLTTKVHAYYRGKPKNNYRLLRDGLHLGDILVSSWVRNLERYHLVNTVGINPFWNGHYDIAGNSLDG